MKQSAQIQPRLYSILLLNLNRILATKLLLSFGGSLKL